MNESIMSPSSYFSPPPHFNPRLHHHPDSVCVQTSVYFFVVGLPELALILVAILAVLLQLHKISDYGPPRASSKSLISQL